MGLDRASEDPFNSTRKVKLEESTSAKWWSECKKTRVFGQRPSSKSWLALPSQILTYQQRSILMPSDQSDISPTALFAQSESECEISRKSGEYSSLGTCLLKF